MVGYADSWLKVEESLGGTRPVLHGTAEEMRASFTGLLGFLASLRPPPSEDIIVEDGRVGDVAYRKYTPRASKDQTLYVGVFYHCGGFVLGDLDSEDAFCRDVALNNNIIIVSVEYRLAPEHKAPAQLEDALALLEWAYHNAAHCGANPSKLLAMGSSAGACLALAVTRKVVLGSSALPKDAVDGVVALCPMTLHPDHVPADYQGLYTSYEENKEGVPIIDKQSMLEFFHNSQASPSDKEVFALLDQAAMKLFPPTYIVTAEKDPLRDDGKALAKTLSLLGASARTDHYGGLPHCFWLFPSLPECDVFMANVKGAITWISSSV